MGALTIQNLLLIDLIREVYTKMQQIKKDVDEYALSNGGSAWVYRTPKKEPKKKEKTPPKKDKK